MTVVLVPIGSSGAAEMVVASRDTAIALGSGDVAVLGTPRMLALLEQATCEALRGHLPDTHTSVGASISLEHRAPTPVDSRVRARANVVEVDGAKVVFDVAADHETAAGEVRTGVATGRITRVIVERSSFAAG